MPNVLQQKLADTLAAGDALIQAGREKHAEQNAGQYAWPVQDQCGQGNARGGP